MAALEGQNVQDALRSTEPPGLLVELQALLQGGDLAAPETAQHAGLQGVGPQ